MIEFLIGMGCGTLLTIMVGGVLLVKYSTDMMKGK